MSYGLPSPPPHFFPPLLLTRWRNPRFSCSALTTCFSSAKLTAVKLASVFISSASKLPSPPPAATASTDTAFAPSSPPLPFLSFAAHSFPSRVLGTTAIGINQVAAKMMPSPLSLALRYFQLNEQAEERAAMIGSPREARRAPPGTRKRSFGALRDNLSRLLSTWPAEG